MQRLAIFLAGPGFAATPLVTPAELEALLGKPAVRVIDVRTDQAYADNPIPGALSAPYGNWFAMSEVVGLKNVALYPGWMVAWTQASPALPMDNAAGRDKIANDAKN